MPHHASREMHVVESYFRELVTNAAQRSPLRVEDTGVPYLVSVLTQYVKPTLSDHELLLNEPLTFALHRAAQKEGPLRVSALRAVGDAVLYLTGYFSEHLAARGVSLAYVQSLGVRAYDLTAEALGHAPNLFHDLAQHFEGYVDLMRDVKESIIAHSLPKTAAGTVALYERWLRSESPAFAAALIARGVLPQRSQAS